MYTSWYDPLLEITAYLLVFAAVCVIPLTAAIIKSKYFPDDI